MPAAVALCLVVWIARVGSHWRLGGSQAHWQGPCRPYKQGQACTQAWTLLLVAHCTDASSQDRVAMHSSLSTHRQLPHMLLTGHGNVLWSQWAGGKQT